jgi:hypothetical protein
MSVVVVFGGITSVISTFNTRNVFDVSVQMPATLLANPLSHTQGPPGGPLLPTGHDGTHEIE